MEEPNQWIKRNKLIVKFLFTGIINTIFGYTIFAIGIFLGMNYTFALLSSTILGIIFNFKTISFFVFNSKDNSIIAKFISIYLLVYIINLLSLKCLTLLRINEYFAGLLTLLPSAAFSFYLNRKYVFKK